MNHTFNVDIATKYGILEAVLLENINFWITKNKANEKNFYDGFYWTYNSITALSKLFPYASRATIFRALNNLENAGLIISGNYNKRASDKTKWYALTKAAERLLNGAECNTSLETAPFQNETEQFQNETSSFQNETTQFQNETDSFQNETAPFQNETITFQSETTLPDINTDINTNINTDINTDGDSTVSKDTVCRTDVQRITERWNSLTRYGIKPVNSINPKTKRYDMLKARVRMYGVDKVLDAVENIKNSAFLCGNNKNGWTITFEWFVRPNNFIKVLEGNYADARTDTTQTPDTGQQRIGKSGYSLELLERLAGGGASGYGQV